MRHVLGANVGFFDVTPLGRILNRFSSDMSTVDEELSQSIGQVGVLASFPNVILEFRC